MGLMDILNGMQNGPRGGSSNPSSGQSSGMSPITMAMLALLAYKAMKSFGGDASAQPQTAPSGNAPAPQPQQGGNDLGSILGGLLPGGLGGALGGGAGGALPGGLGGALAGGGLGGLLGGLLGGGAGSGGALRGGLDDLLRQFEENGHGEATQSWVGNGSNQPVSPDAIRKTLGDDTLGSLAQQAGLSEVDLVNGLSQHLPEFINRLTPDGRMPTHDEMSRIMRD